MTREEFEHQIAPWLALADCPGIGVLRANALIRHFGSPEAIFSRPLDALAEVVGNQRYAKALLQAPSPEHQVAKRSAFEWLTGPVPAQLNKAIITQNDARYPAQLKEIADPPLLLYALGASALLHPDAPVWWQQGRGFLAIVGSRAPTAQGELNALQISADVQQAGLCVVSGLALGIDGAAHAGALQHAVRNSLATVAVMGTGIDRIYPRYHQDLAQRIARAGLLLTEQPIGAGPLASHFPKRNRIITGLAQATLVVEAAEKSGSLISARLAAEQGRDVMAIPGSIHSPQARGCHGLIKQGAKLVENAADVLEEFAPVALSPAKQASPLPHRHNRAIVAVVSATSSAPAAPTPQAQSERLSAFAVPPRSPAIQPSMPTPTESSASAKLLQAMGWDPVHLEQLQARTGLPTAVLQAQLLELELAQQVARMPGAFFQRIAQA